MIFLLDTNTISYIINKNRRYRENIRKRIFFELLSGNDIAFSALNYYEIKRGLSEVSSEKKELFERICENYHILLFDDLEIFNKASDIYSNLRRKGELIPESDILIASLAMVKGAIVVTHDAHFQRIRGLETTTFVMND